MREKWECEYGEYHFQGSWAWDVMANKEAIDGERTTETQTRLGNETAARGNHEDRRGLMRVLLRELDLAVVAAALVGRPFRSFNH